GSRAGGECFGGSSAFGGGAGAAAGADSFACCVCLGASSVFSGDVVAEDDSSAFASVSIFAMTPPTLTLSPGLRLISDTTPAAVDGTSNTAFSVSNSISGWSTATVSPCATRTLVTSPLSTFSEISGRRTSTIISADYATEPRWPQLAKGLLAHHV